MAVILLAKTARLGYTHCGIVWQGQVLHATENGVQLQDMASIRDAWPIAEYWAWSP